MRLLRKWKETEKKRTETWVLDTPMLRGWVDDGEPAKEKEQQGRQEENRGKPAEDCIPGRGSDSLCQMLLKGQVQTGPRVDHWIQQCGGHCWTWQGHFQWVWGNCLFRGCFKENEKNWREQVQINEFCCKGNSVWLVARKGREVLLLCSFCFSTMGE